MYCISGHSKKTFHSHVTLKGARELSPVRPSAQHNWPILDTLIINEANKEHFISPEKWQLTRSFHCDRADCQPTDCDSDAVITLYQSNKFGMNTVEK